jgi:hypothetical protein
MLLDNKEKILELNDKFLKTEQGEKEITIHIRQSEPTTENENQEAANNLITLTSIKKEIVGKYTYSTSYEDEEGDITTIASVNATCSFNADGTYEDSGTLMITYIDEEGYQTNLKYKIEMFGKYDIQKSYIIYDCNLENIKIILLQTDDYDISNLLDEHYIPQMKQEMLLDNKEKILELNDKFLKTEQGEKEITIYIRQSEPTTENKNQETANNLITLTSIAGVEIIGKTPQEIKPNINNALIWEYIEELDGQREGYLVKNEEYPIFRLYISNGKITAIEIYAADLVTKEKLHVGSTTGDILKIYPDATVCYAEFGEYTKHNDIIYIYNTSVPLRISIIYLN